MSDQDARSDMYLEVDVHIDGACNGETVSVNKVIYTQGTSSPSSPGVVQSDGTINLNLMEKSRHHNTKTVHITFNVDGTITGPDNKDLPLFFPTNLSDAITIDDNPPSGGFSVQSDGSTASFILTNDDDDVSKHNYCLQPQVSYDDTTIPVDVDPQMIDRGAK